jgi:phage baseplate assembly protein W|tara:strand:+ start:758 stop:1198 length:441 start_codon:yes stop_codon:yes gene_type:complete
MALEIRDIDNSSFRYRKTSRSFKDISLTFAKNPVTNDILPIKNEDAIKKSVMNLVKTRLGERFFNDLLGTRLEDSLFEVGTSSLIYSLESEIAILLENFEPRINNTKVFGEYQDESNDLLLRITYDIVGLPIPTQEIEFILEPTRI